MWPGTIFALLSTGMSQFIICQGFPKIAMFSVVLGAVLNIALDPVFIFVLRLGVAGAAIATVLSQLASCCFVLRFLFGPWPQVSIGFKGYAARIMGRILAIGFTPFAIIAVDNVMIIAMNMVLQRYGGAQRGDMLVTCATIAQSFMLVVTMPLGGITGGTQSILSYNYGACHVGRVRAGQRRIFGLCLGFTALMTAVAWLGGPLFVRLFTADAQVAAQAQWAIRVCTLSLLPLGLQYEDCGRVHGHRAGALLAAAVVLAQARLLCGAVRLPGPVWGRGPPSLPSPSPTCWARRCPLWSTCS